MATIDPQELAGRYVAVWNEPDAKLRREAIRGLWAEDGTHILQPPSRSSRPPPRWASPPPPCRPAGTPRSKCG
jgi:hypothetical protein